MDEQIGMTLTIEDLENAAKLAVENFGRPTQLIMSPHALVGYDIAFANTAKLTDREKTEYHLLNRYSGKLTRRLKIKLTKINNRVLKSIFGNE